ncbi:MAG: OB-fold domain-containing protein [Acidimicrobiia bacterium]|nr:OB-fold domain-containing protein [Acidimicrobiia bacterium]
MIDIGTVRRDDRSGPFFDAAAEGRLVARRCDECGHLYGAELPTCSACASEAHSWIDVEGVGSLVSWVVVHRKGGEGAAPAPIAVATVELAEGPWLTLPVDPGPDAAAPDAGLVGGASMRAGFQPVEGGETVPVWEIAGA